MSVCLSVSLSGDQCLCVLCIQRFVSVSVLGFQSLDYCICESVSLRIITPTGISVPACVPKSVGFL